MKTIIAMLTAVLAAILVFLTLVPTSAVADDCNGCGPHKSKFE